MQVFWNLVYKQVFIDCWILMNFLNIDLCYTINVSKLCWRVRKEKKTPHQTWNFKKSKGPNVRISTNVIKGVLARSRLSTVGVLKLMCKNILGSSCKLYLYLKLLHIRKIRGWWVRLTCFPWVVGFTLKLVHQTCF